ncbi:MAG: hypothetical protein R3A47_04040 [Polyangiales bacterium]
MRGGNLDTVISELNLLPENTLNAYCAAVFGMLPAARDDLMNVEPDVANALTREFAIRHRVLPIAVHGQSMILAVDRPLAREVIQEIEQELRVIPAQRIVTTVRLESALSKFLDIGMTTRMRTLRDKLEHRDSGEVPYVKPLDSTGRMSRIPSSPQSMTDLASFGSPVSHPPRRSDPVLDDHREEIPSRSIPSGTFSSPPTTHSDFHAAVTTKQPSLPREYLDSATNSSRYSVQPKTKERLGSSMPPPHPRRTSRRVSHPTLDDPRRENDGTAVVHDVVVFGDSMPSRGKPSLPDVNKNQWQSTPARPSRSSVPPSANVVVHMGPDVEQVINELWEMGPEDDALSLLPVLGVGDAALPILVREFPGPLWFDRRHPHLRIPAGRNISPIARALVAFGNRAVKYLASLLDQPNADVRYYAVLTAMEFVDPKLVEPLGRRLFDPDIEVRDVARRALSRLRGCSPQYDELLYKLRSIANAARDRDAQLIAIDSLGRLCDVDAFPQLLDLLGSDDSEIVATAHASLVRISCQDFGALQKRWQAWYQQHAGQSRVQWLIVALDHPDLRLRKRASDELQQLTQVYMGYRPDASPHDRQIIIKKYEQWWNAEGHLIFVDRRPSYS